MELKKNLTATAIAIIAVMMISGEPWSWGHAAESTASGAIIGGFAGPLQLVWGFNGAVAGGAVRGMITQFGW